MSGGDPIRFGVLGPVAVWPPDGGAPIELAAREATLLAALLVRPGQPVWSEQLIDAVWGMNLPSDSGAALHNVVYRLRRAFATAPLADPVRVLGSGYALVAHPQEVDAGRFESRLATSAVFDATEARETLQEALALWRGQAFEGLTAAWSEFATEAQRLEALWFVALERRVECDLALGRGRDVVGELLSLTTRWPGKENLWGLLMQALHQAGMRDEALRTYRRLREYLVGEIGIEPSRSLRELERAILSGEPGAVPSRR